MRLSGWIVLGSFLFLPFMQGEEVWIIDQEFVKLGKREVYELLKKKRIDELDKRGFPVLTLQDSEPSEYIYLLPIGSYQNLESYFSAEQAMRTPAKDGKVDEMLESTYHFKVASLQRYLPSCSYGSSNMIESPYCAYYIYSVAPGYDDGYEAYLEKKTEEYKAKKSPLNWKVWKTAFGSDLPKFVICLFAKTKEELDAQMKLIDFTDDVSKTIFRNQHQGKATLRKELSTFTNTEKS